MPLFLAPLVAWLSSTSLAVISFFLTRKGILFAVMATVVTMVGALITAVVSELDALIGSVIPSTSLVAMFAPTNTVACFSAILAAHVACTSYKMAVKFIRWKTEIMTS